MNRLKALVESDYAEGINWEVLSDGAWLAIALQYAEPTTRIIKWNGLELGIQYEVGTIRHDVPLACCYGHIRNHRSPDGKSLDCLVGMNLKSDRVFEIQQTGDDPEPKIMIGFGSEGDAIANYLYHYPESMFGGCREIEFDELVIYRA